MNNKLFGTDGIRGFANRYPMDADLAFNLGKSIGYYNRHKKGKKIVIGKDTRISGDMLEAAITAGLCSSGLNVLNAGVITTPAIGFLTKYFKANMGIVISASHNPYYDNGIKIFQENGLKISHKIETEIEKILLQKKYNHIFSGGKNIGRAFLLKESKEIYIKHLLNTIPKSFYNPGYTIVLDCANGASSSIVPELFTELGIKNKIINNAPDGININQKCGSTHTVSLQKKVIEERADLGLAFDGDADRVLAVDEKGMLVDGDQIMFICASALLKENKLGNNIIVATHMSNLGLDESINKIGGTVIRTDIGDKHVLKQMLDIGSTLGGEQSGHIIFLPFSPNGDGIVTSFQFLNALNKTTSPVSILAQQMKRNFQKLINYKIPNKDLLIKNKKYNEMKKFLQNYFKNEGRVLIRLSGTENKIRILLESKDKKSINKCKKIINQYMDEIINSV